MAKEAKTVAGPAIVDDQYYLVTLAETVERVTGNWKRGSTLEVRGKVLKTILNKVDRYESVRVSA